MDSFLTDAAQWIALAHSPLLSAEQKNMLAVRVLHERQRSWAHFFSLPADEWHSSYGLPHDQCECLGQIRDTLPASAFLAEDVASEGFRLLPLNHAEYPPTVKKILKTKESPLLLYAKGARTILNTVALTAVADTDVLPAEAVAPYDKLFRTAALQGQSVAVFLHSPAEHALLLAALGAGTRCVAILPSGIQRFDEGYLRYYRHIAAGTLMVLSSAHPRRPFSEKRVNEFSALRCALSHTVAAALCHRSSPAFVATSAALRRGQQVVALPSPLQGDLLALGAIPSA